jgi:serine/threonine protein phosphatase PrpC
MVDDAQIEKLLTTPTDDLQQIADALVDAANEAGGLDNVTALVVKVEP